LGRNNGPNKIASRDEGRITACSGQRLTSGPRT
jgi:hypothetical protein